MEADSAGSDRTFVCDYCPKKYLRKNNLEDHILMEHPDTEQVGLTGQKACQNPCIFSFLKWTCSPSANLSDTTEREIDI